jgi:hypothetical protein
MRLKLCDINTLNAELNPICHLLALLGAHHILHISGLRVKHRTTAADLTTNVSKLRSGVRTYLIHELERV